MIKKLGVLAMVFALAFVGVQATAQLAIKSEKFSFALYSFKGAIGDGLQIRAAHGDEDLKRVDELLLDVNTSKHWAPAPIEEEDLEMYREKLREVVTRRENTGYSALSGLYLIVDLANKNIIGIANVSEFTRPREFYRIGYAIHPDQRGRGVATRAVKLMVASLQQLRPAFPIEAIVDYGNLASRKVLSKNGFVFDGTSIWSGSAVCDYLLSPQEP